MKPAALTVRECCASLNFWLLFAVFGAGTGIGLMFVNNLGACPHAALQLTSADTRATSVACRPAKHLWGNNGLTRFSMLCQQE